MSIGGKLFWGLLLVCVTLVSSCGDKSNKQHPSLAELESIQLSRLEIDSVTPLALDETRNGVISHKSYVIKACFVDGASFQKMSASQFIVDGLIKTSDIEGCLFWNEQIEVPTDGRLAFERKQKIVKIQGLSFEKVVEYQINPYDSKIINLQHTNGTALAANKVDSIEGFSLEKLKVSFSGFVSSNDSSVRFQKYLASVDVCLVPKNKYLTVENLIGKSATVNVTGESVIQVQENSNIVDAEGCLKFSYQDTADMFGDNSWKERVVQVQIGDIDLSRKFAVNPIEKKTEFFWDLRRGPAPRAATIERPRLVLDKMRYTFIGNEDSGFTVNEYLEMSLVKSYQLELEPKLNYGHEFQGDIGPRPIFNGNFRLQFLLLTPKNGDMEITASNLEQFDVLTKYQGNVELRDGRISTTLELPFLFTDLQKAVTRTLAIIKIVSVENPELSAIVTGPFHASTHQFSVGMREFERFESGDKLEALTMTVAEKLNSPSPVQFDSEGRLISPWRLKPIDLYKELHKNVEGLEELKILTRTQSEKDLKLKVSETELKNFIKGNYLAKDLSRFCSVIYPSRVVEGWIWDSVVNDDKYGPCLREPQKYLDVKSVKHIQKILSKPERVYSSTDRINIGSGFFFFKTDSSRESWARRWSAGTDIGVKFEVPFIKLVSVGGKAGYDISYMKSRDLSMGETSRGSLSRTRNIYADMLRLSFKANTLSCFNIQGQYFEEAQQVKRSAKRFQICLDKLEIEELDESWYYMGESDPTMSLLRDRWSNKENMMIKLLRGQKNFEQFYNLMADDTKVVFLHKVETLKGPDAYFSRIYSKNDGTAPSLEDGAIPGTVEP